MVAENRQNTIEPLPKGHSTGTDFAVFGNLRMGDVRTLYQVKERVRQKSAAAIGVVSQGPNQL